MSQDYDLGITVTGANPDKVPELIEVIQDLWGGWDDVLDWSGFEPATIGKLTSSGGDYLYGGMDLYAFTDHVFKMIWKTNEAYCDVVVMDYPLPILPSPEEYVGDESDYEEWLAELSA